MFHYSSIARLYANVIHEEIVQYGVSEQEIRTGVQAIAYVYRPNPNSLQLDNMTVANYNEIGPRCAYLHKNAAFHTALVMDVMNLILKIHKSLFQELVTTGQFKICSLGGGPGPDAVGIIAALNFTFGIFKKEVVIIDIMEDWKLTFDAVVQQIIYGDYSITQNFLPHCFQWNYIGHNLLDSMPNTTNKAISNANFISMIKFVSATSCQDTEAMVTKIFRVMKPGALVLFIDNAAGGFHELVKRAARQVGLVTILGDKNPFNHYKYSKDELQCIRFGYTSCYTTTVAIHLLQKPRQNQQTESYYPNHPQQQNSYAPATIFWEPNPTLDNARNTSTTRNNRHVPYLHTYPEPAYVNVQPSYGRSSRSSTQYEPDEFDDESTNESGDCSCCVIS